jgi:hypothetical protein
MKEGLKSEIKMLHTTLKNKGGWYLDVSSPDDETIQDMAMTAKENADAELTELTVNALYSRYNRWRGEDHMDDGTGNYFDRFLSDICFDMGRDSLGKAEKPIFDESCSMTFHWL